MSHWNYRRFVWEWEFLEGMDADTVVRRQLAEMPDWVQRAVRSAKWALVGHYGGTICTPDGRTLFPLSGLGGSVGHPPGF